MRWMKKIFKGQSLRLQNKIDLRAKQLRENFYKNDILNVSPIGKLLKEIEYLSEHSAREGRYIRETKLYGILEYAQIKKQ